MRTCHFHKKFTVKPAYLKKVDKRLPKLPATMKQKLYRRSDRRTSPVYLSEKTNMGTSTTTSLVSVAENHYVSADFLRSRESIYRLVDIIDKLFDGIVEQR